MFVLMHVPVSGIRWIIHGYCCSYLGLALEGPRTHRNFQGIVDCDCCHYEFHISWLCSWEVLIIEVCEPNQPKN